MARLHAEILTPYLGSRDICCFYVQFMESLTPRSRAPHEKLIAAHLLKKWPHMMQSEGSLSYSQEQND